MICFPRDELLIGNFSNYKFLKTFIINLNDKVVCYDQSENYYLLTESYIVG